MAVISIAFLVVSAGTFILSLDYRNVASENITIVSITLAVYMASFSTLVSSELLKNMKNKRDALIQTKTEFGVLKVYFKTAITFGIGNIVIGCCFLLVNYGIDCLIYRLASAAAIGFMVTNLLMVWLLFSFMLNKQLHND